MRLHMGVYRHVSKTLEFTVQQNTDKSRTHRTTQTGRAQLTSWPPTVRCQRTAPHRVCPHRLPCSAPPSHRPASWVAAQTRPRALCALLGSCTENLPYECITSGHQRLLMWSLLACYWLQPECQCSAKCLLSKEFHVRSAFSYSSLHAMTNSITENAT